MINYKAQIALDLVPVLGYLQEGGIIAINPSYIRGPSVQMRKDTFRETFPEVDTPEDNPGSIYPYIWRAKVNGVEFFALAEGNDGLGG